MVMHRPAPGVIEKAARIRMVLTDCDGVLTDGGVYYSAHGEELKRFSMRDGMGVERLFLLAGVSDVGIVTRETSPLVAARAAKLGLGDDLYAGVTDKRHAAEDVARRQGISLDEIAFIGDDMNDLDLLRVVGLSACPADAEPVVSCEVDSICTRDAAATAHFRGASRSLISRQPRNPARTSRAGDLAQSRRTGRHGRPRVPSRR